MEVLLARLSARGAARIALPDQPLRVQAGLLRQGPTHALVLRAVTSGCLVTSGTISLPAATVMLFTGCGAHFRGVTFSCERPSPVTDKVHV